MNGRSFAVACLLVLAGTLFAHAAPRVDLSLVTAEGFPITGQQQWLQTLGRLDFDSVRIRRATGNDKVEVIREGSDASPVYRVTGFLTRDNQLILPNGRFTIRDSAAIADWKERLQKGGAAGLEPKVQAAFGLTADQFVDVHTKLATPIVFSTKGQTPKAVVRSIAESVAITVDSESLKAFEHEWVIPEEMDGMAMGTVLAAAVRPLGLVIVPKATGENVQLVIVDVRKGPQSWPVGWPLEKPEREVAPKMFEFFTFEAPGNPLQQALDAIGGNLGMPMLYDHNGMARQQIDPEKVMIEFPESRSYYKKVLARVLFQAKMKCDLRVDEAGQPFLWIAPLKQG